MRPKKQHHDTGHDDAGTPVALPHAIVTVTRSGELDVTVDGARFSSAQQDGAAWTRSDFGELMDAITADRTITVRVEVRETDGSVFTDVIHARRPTRPAPNHHQTGDVATPQRPGTGEQRRGRGLVEVTGEGFVPGEDIAVALIVSHTDATGTGHVRALIDTDTAGPIVQRGTNEVVLLGRVSGTLLIRRLP